MNLILLPVSIFVVISQEIVFTVVFISHVTCCAKVVSKADLAHVSEAADPSLAVLTVYRKLFYS